MGSEIQGSREKSQPAVGKSLAKCEPLHDKGYSEGTAIMLSEIADLSLAYKRNVGEGRVLSMLVSLQKIARSSPNPEKDVSAVQRAIHRAYEKHNHTAISFTISFLESMLGGSSFQAMLDDVGRMESIPLVSDVVCLNAPGDARYESFGVIYRIASLDSFFPEAMDASCVVASRTKGYGVYLGLLMIDGIMSNRAFSRGWLTGSAILQISDFADYMERHTTGNGKYEYYEMFRGHMANRYTPDVGIEGVLNGIVQAVKDGFGRYGRPKP
jgi:hypothetical protein